MTPNRMTKSYNNLVGRSINLIKTLKLAVEMCKKVTSHLVQHIQEAKALNNDADPCESTLKAYQHNTLQCPPDLDISSPYH